MKRVLVIVYSQSGQLERIVRAIIEPLESSPDVEVWVEHIRPRKPYPFPWNLREFFQAVPECAHLNPPPMEPFTFDPEAPWDLVIVAYQVWFLAPSLPAVGFLKSREGARVLRNRPVITVIGCREMWTMAHQKVKKLLDAHGASLIDNIVMIDRRSGLGSFFNTPFWLLTGKKATFFGWLPRPGVDEKDVRDGRRFGEAILKGLLEGAVARKETLLRGMGAVTIDSRLVPVEWAGEAFFQLWSFLARAAGPFGSLRRDPVIIFFALIFPLVLSTAVPTILVSQWLLKPVVGPFIARQVARYAEPSGCERGSSGEERDGA